MFSLLLAAMLWQTWPFNGTRTLPTTVKPSDAKAEVTVVSARGVRATFAAAVRADAAASGVRPTVGTVKTDDGATFDVGTAEVRWVKCTEKDPNAWFSSVPGIGEKTLVPDLLVSGATDLAKDETREFLFRLEIPAAAKPGLYRGKLAFASSAGMLAETPFILVPKTGKDTLVGAAVEEGLVDARYLSAVSQAAHKLRYAKDYKLTLEGRMGSFFVDQNDDIEERSPDLDVLRLEAIATLVRFDAFLANAKEAK